MGEDLIPLHELTIGSFGRVKKITAQGRARRRMLDLGLINGTIVEPLLVSPAGDPIAYQIRGAIIALRLEEASKILVETVC